MNNELDRKEGLGSESGRRMPEAFLEMALEAMPQPVWAKDGHGRLAYCNAAFESFYGCEREIVLGQAEADIVGGAMGNTEAEAVAWACDEERIWEGGRCDAHGDWRSLEIRSRRLRGAAPLLLFTQTDHSDLKAVGARLEQACETMDAMMEMALVLDGRNGRVLEANGRAVSGLGYPRNALIGMSAAELFPQIRPEQFLASLAKASSEAEGGGRLRSLMMRQTGSVFAAEAQLVVLPRSGGRVSMLVRDVTQSLKDESDLRQSNHDLKMMSAVNKAIVGADSERNLLEWVCGILEGRGDFSPVYARLVGEKHTVDYAATGREKGLQAALGELGLDSSRLQSALACGNAPALFRAKPQLTRPEGCLPRLVIPGAHLAVYLPMRRGNQALGGLFLFAKPGSRGIEERLERLQEIADDVAFGIATQRQAVARRRAEELAAQRMRVERAVAKYSNGLSSGDDYAVGASAGLDQLRAAVGADQAFLYEAGDLNDSGQGARRLCSLDSGEEGRVRRLPDFLRLNFSAAEAAVMPQEFWTEHLGLQLAEGDRLLAFPLLAGERCFGLVGYLFLGHDGGRDVASAAMLRLAAQVMGELHERGRADRRIRLLAAAIDSTDEGIFIVEAGSLVFERSPMLLVSEGVCRMSGYARERLLGRAPELLLADGSRIQVEQDRLREGGEPARGKTKFQRADGSTFLVEYTVYPVFGASGKAIHYICIHRDITRRLEMETRLAFANKMESVGQLSAGIAHEINTPAQFIGDNLSFLRDACERLTPMLERLVEGGDERERRRMSRLVSGIPAAISDACEGVDRISTIVKAMREFSHPEKRFALADLNRCIETTVTVARNEWKYVAELDLELDEDLEMVEMMPGDINQVILNLIVNAAHAIEAKNADGSLGKIAIATKDMEDLVRVTISDTGGGIPEQIGQSVFDPFFTTKEVGKGTGQGLFMAHAIIEQRHGGRLWFESEPGIGTKFFFEIPMKRKVTSDGDN